jgi:hypothetical protein
LRLNLASLIFLLCLFNTPAWAVGYSDNGDGSVTNPSTGLTWMRCSMGQTWTGSTCNGVASTYTWDQANALTGTVNFAGKSDWRLPNIRELISIVDRSRYAPAIDRTVFLNTTSSELWSATARAYSSTDAWYVGVDTGYSTVGTKGFTFQAHLVRGGQSSALLNLARPTSDYVDHGDGTVTHTPTGLMWKQCPEGPSACLGLPNNYYTWAEANASASNSFAGYSDWRLPTEEELLTLVDYTGPALNLTIFPGTPRDWIYWSATAAADPMRPPSSWGVNFASGAGQTYWSGITLIDPIDKLHVRLVRSGQSPRVSPSAPTAVNVTAGNALAIVSFFAPTSDGGSAITKYTVTATPGGLTAMGTTSPITITGLTNGTAYTFTVTATNATGTSLSSAASNSVTPAAVTPTNGVVDIRSYIPAANAKNGYQNYLRVINIGSTATPVNVQLIDGTTGLVGTAGQMTASLPAGAAVTFTAQQVEAALGQALALNDRPRIRVTASGQIEVQSFMANPEGVVTQISDALTAGTGYAVRNYVPSTAAGAYTSYVRIINIGSAASPIQIGFIDDTTGVAGRTVQFLTLPAGAAVTLSSQQLESWLGFSLNASSRPRVSITSASTLLEVQSFVSNPRGTVTQIGSAQSGTSVAVRTFFPAATASLGYTGYIRVINPGTTATPINVSILDEGNGQAIASGQLVANLPGGAATTFSAQQVEAALGISLQASARPRLLVTTSTSVDVQAFVSNPWGTVTQLLGAQSGSTVDVRTYVPAVNANGGYTSYIRIINTGTTATPVSVAVIDGPTGVVGAAGQLTPSLPAGAAVTFTALQVETAIGKLLPANDRPRIRVTASASTLDVQSFMFKPGAIITETMDFQ